MRGAAPRHTLIATGALWSTVDGLVSLTPVRDPNVVYTFHFYEPHTFTHQNQPWANTAGLHDIPYPADSATLHGRRSRAQRLERRAPARAVYCGQRWDAPGHRRGARSRRRVVARTRGADLRRRVRGVLRGTRGRSAGMDPGMSGKRSNAGRSDGRYGDGMIASVSMRGTTTPACCSSTPTCSGRSASGRRYMTRYLGPLPPSRGVQRGPSTSVALQSTQFGAFTRSSSPTRSYTPAGHMWA